MMHRTLAALALAVMLTACGDQGARYKLPIAEAHQILVATGLPPQVFGSEEPEYQVLDGGSDVIWVVKRDGGELFRYVAHLADDGGGATRVKVELIGAKSGPGGDVAKRLADNPKIRDMYVVAVTERVASALEKRPFELGRVYPAMTAATMANMGKIQASADDAAAASEKEARDNIEKAYRDEANGVRH